MLLGIFFSGDSDRGGVFEVEVRLPRETMGIQEKTFLRIAFFWLFDWTKYEIPVRSMAMASNIKDWPDGT